MSSRTSEYLVALNKDDFLQIVKNTPLVSIDVVILDPLNSALLGLRNNSPAKNYWFVPGGRIQKNESIEQAFRRITTNELGAGIASELTFDGSQFLGVFEHFYETNFADAPGFGTHYVVLAYRTKLRTRSVAEHLSSLTGEQEKDQHREFAWFTPDEILNSPEVHPYTQRYFENQAH